MAIKINGTTLSLQPSESNWSERDELGINGSGHPVYSAVRQYEMSWELMPIPDFSQILGFYNGVSNTGTISIDLPKFDGTTFIYQTYSGCTLKEPAVGAYFVDHVSNVRLLVMNIRG